MGKARGPLRRAPSLLVASAVASIRPLDAWGPRGGLLQLPRVIRFANQVGVELMAGSRRLSAACVRAGLAMRSFEFADSPLEDALHPDVFQLLLAVAGRGLKFVWIGLVCTSWSRARRNPHPGNWPGPIRSRDCILGLPGLSEKDQGKVELGNRQADWAVSLFSRLASLGVPVIIENPQGSMLWLHPRFQALLSKYGFIDWDHCAFGSCYRKRTRLLYANCVLDGLCSDRCQGRGVCSFTNQPHIEIAGKDEKGTFHSEKASAYPVKFCDKIAHILCHSL